ncbi:hypothetical protein GH714_008622 [Hevea brasiliensis]|uniref:Uncharacterized protein n=1 Tax=Hevea brasiliensis TaxID=3981 RepID=A0A6A6NBG0_HEVBR|nr:hypothetical protein GH714_008622 [Hevea brasiliensis]
MQDDFSEVAELSEDESKGDLEEEDVECPTIQISEGEKKQLREHFVNGYYIVCFTNEMEYKKVLFGGPWMVADWQPNFDPKNAVIDRALVWVRILNLPIEYYARSFLLRVGSKIWHPIKADNNTL